MPFYLVRTFTSTKQRITLLNLETCEKKLSPTVFLTSEKETMGIFTRWTCLMSSYDTLKVVLCIWVICIMKLSWPYYLIIWSVFFLLLFINHLIVLFSRGTSLPLFLFVCWGTEFSFWPFFSLVCQRYRRINAT